MNGKNLLKLIMIILIENMKGKESINTIELTATFLSSCFYLIKDLFYAED